MDDEETSVDDGKQSLNEFELDLEAGPNLPPRRKSSGYSRVSSERPLLHNHDLTKTDSGGIGQGTRYSQKLHVTAEDLTIVIAGFSTSVLGFCVYFSICTLSLGLGYLILRWLPRWRVRLIGARKPLCDCDWVVIEVRSRLYRRKRGSIAKTDQNQWGQFDVHDINRMSYGYAASTVFGVREDRDTSVDYDDEDDPIMAHLHFLDYHYTKFCFDPFKDEFVLCSGWKDPTWVDIKSIRAGLDSDERHRREQVFGKNQIEIQQKSTPQLLVDEVSNRSAQKDHF